MMAAIDSRELATIEERALAVPGAVDLTYIQRLGNLLCASGYFSDAREMAQAAVKVMAGHELGIAPIASMMGINVIKGKVALSGNLIASRIRAHGYEYRHKQFDATGCVLEFLSKADASGKRTLMGESSFTEKDAKDAGVYSDMYKKYPRNMYFNRAMSNGAKWYTPEVFAGAPVYVPEELGATVDEQGDMVHPEPTPKQQAEAVAAAKISQMKAGKSYAEVSTHDERQNPADAMIPAPAAEPLEAIEPQIKARLAQFKKMRETIGDPDYYRILGAHGVEHANEIKSLNEARVMYREMAELWGERNGAQA